MNEQKKLDKKIDKYIDIILADLTARKNMISVLTDTDRMAHQEFLAHKCQMPADTWQYLLQVTNRCIGCGICEKVCPSASIHVVDGKAQYISGNCQTCLTCAHACPQKAIQLTIPEKDPNARYWNEHILLREIMEAYCQILCSNPIQENTQGANYNE